MSYLKNRTFLLIIAGIFLAIAMWYSFLRDKTPAPLIQSADLTRATGADSDVVQTLLQLRAVSLSGTIFSEPAFMSLQDFGSQIVPEPVGRMNPFAPLSSSAAATTTTATTPPKKVPGR